LHIKISGTSLFSLAKFILSHWFDQAIFCEFLSIVIISEKADKTIEDFDCGGGLEGGLGCWSSPGQSLGRGRDHLAVTLIVSSSTGLAQTG
jgi:hypothetical protein